MPTQALYICYFGLREPLVQTQVLPYLREIAKLTEVGMHLLTFEPDLNERWSPDDISGQREKLRKDGIEWHVLPYHKRPSMLATFYDVLNGIRFIRRLSSRENIKILHARTHIPMLMAMNAAGPSDSRIIFDIRGLVAEEYADAGIWREGSMPFRLVKQVEKRGIERASQIVVLTERMRDYLVENGLKQREAIEVIPCCVDFSRVNVNGNRPQKRERFELIYAGSVSGLYLIGEMGRFFLNLKERRKDAFFRILTAGPPEIVRETFAELGIADEDFTVLKAAPEDVPGFLEKAHLGISFRKSTFAQIAASPTKIPEYLACGLPVIANGGIGDMDRLILENDLGVVIDDFSEKDLSNAADKVLDLLEQNGIDRKCSRLSTENFHLTNIGGESYRNVYRRILQSNKNS